MVSIFCEIFYNLSLQKKPFKKINEQKSPRSWKKMKNDSRNLLLEAMNNGMLLLCPQDPKKIKKYKEWMHFKPIISQASADDDI